MEWQSEHVGGFQKASKAHIVINLVHARGVGVLLHLREDRVVSCDREGPNTRRTYRGIVLKREHIPHLISCLRLAQTQPLPEGWRETYTERRFQKWRAGLKSVLNKLGIDF